MKLELVDPESVLLECLEGKTAQREIATIYAFAITGSDAVDFRKVNTAIITKWSRSGLERVKKMAWGMINKKAKK